MGEKAEHHWAQEVMSRSDLHTSSSTGGIYSIGVSTHHNTGTCFYSSKHPHLTSATKWRQSVFIGVVDQKAVQEGRRYGSDLRKSWRMLRKEPWACACEQHSFQVCSQMSLCLSKWSRVKRKLDFFRGFPSICETWRAHTPDWVKGSFPRVQSGNLCWFVAGNSLIRCVILRSWKIKRLR